MSTTASVFEDQAAIFTAELRSQLTDLPSDELDDLLDGLQADLTDRLADGDELGDPQSYAAELRQAAGLPPRNTDDITKTRRSLGAALGDAGQQWVQKVSTFFDATPARQGIRDFVLSLRPVWWIMRGLVLAGTVLFVAGIPVYRIALLSWPAMLYFLLFVIVSVQWGRGLWAPKRWLVVLRRVVSVIAVIALIPISAMMLQSIRTPTSYAQEPVQYWGLNIDGESVTNIFAYDCSGHPIDVVQLYDQNGIPLTPSRQPGVASGTGWDEATQETIMYFPNGAVVGDGRWNAYPFSESRWGPTEESPYPTMTENASRADAAEWPFAERGPLNAVCAAIDAGAGADAGTSEAPKADAEAGTGTGAEAAPTDPTAAEG